MVNRLTQRGIPLRTLVSALAVACVFALPSLVRAQIGTGWKGTGGNSNWTNAGNWDNTGPNAGARDLFFGNGWVNAGSSGSTIANNDISGYSGHKIIFENNASSTSFTITGNGFTLFDFGGATPVFPQIENDSSFLQTFNLNSAQTITLNDTSGSNKAEINPVNGNLAFGTNTTVAMGGNTQLQVWGNNGKIVTFNGPITGGSSTNSLALNQNSIVVFNADNTYIGDTFVNAGTLQINNAGTNGNSSIRLGDTTGTASATLTLVGANTFNSTINARAGSSGTKTVSATNANGTTATLGGHIALDDNMILTSANAGALISISQARSTATGTTAGTDLKNKVLTITGAGNITFGAGTTPFGTVYDSVSGGSIVMSGTGTLTMNDGNNSYRGGTRVNSGTLLIGASDNSTSTGPLGGANLSAKAVLLGNTSGSSNASLLMNGPYTIANIVTVQSGNTGTITIGGNTADASTFSGAVNLGTASGTAKNATFIAQTGGSVNFAGVIDENTSVPVSGVTIGDVTHTGTVRFSNTANGYGGVTTISNGAILEVVKLSLSGNNSLGNASQNVAANVVISGGTLRYVGTGDNSNRLFTFDANGATLDVTSGFVSYNNTLNPLIASGSGSRTLTLTGTTTGNNIASVIPDPSSGATSLTKSGGGSWSVGLSNTYTGVTTINGGTLLISALAPINTASSIGKGSAAGSAADLVLNGGTLSFTGPTNQSTNRLFSVGLSGATLDGSGSDNSTALSFTGSGALGFNGQSGARTLTLTGSNTGPNTLAAAIGDNGGATSLNKTGDGTWILSGTSGYSGATSVTQGTLRVTGSIVNSPVTASGTGTIGGSGTIGALIVDSGGTVAPGNSVGALTGASADLKSGGAYVWEISNATAAAGTGYDVLNQTGAVNVSATNASPFTVKVTSSAAVTNFNMNQNWLWTIASGGSAVTNFAADKFVIDTSQFTDDNAVNGSFSIEASGGDLRIRYTVPEPATMSLLLPLAGLALARRNRRGRR
jgi:fibronectin-binding autotransporter adhesin